MAYEYLKAAHIIFVVTWFAGLFYMPRLFIYNVEALGKPEHVRIALQAQFLIMMKRLWYGITWPSAVITFVLGLTVLFRGGWDVQISDGAAKWLIVKLVFVFLLYLYHFTLHAIYKQQTAGVFKYSSRQLRIWNEVATVFLVSIVLLATVKESFSFIYGIIFLVAFIALLFSAIRIYSIIRKKK